MDNLHCTKRGTKKALCQRGFDIASDTSLRPERHQRDKDSIAITRQDSCTYIMETERLESMEIGEERETERAESRKSSYI